MKTTVWEGTFYRVEKYHGGTYYNRGSNYVGVSYSLFRKDAGRYNNVKTVEYLSDRPTKKRVAELVEKAKTLEAAEPARLAAEKSESERQSRLWDVKAAGLGLLDMTADRVSYSAVVGLEVKGKLPNGINVSLFISGEGEIGHVSWNHPSLTDTHGDALLKALSSLRIEA